REDSEATSRPMLAANLEPDALDSNVQHLAIGNYGRGVARGVRVEFDPSPLVTDPQHEAADLTAYVESRYANVIATWVPVQQFRNVYMHWTKKAIGNQLPLPDEFTVTISYRSDGGHDYEDRFALTTEYLSGQTITE